MKTGFYTIRLWNGPDAERQIYDKLWTSVRSKIVEYRDRPLDIRLLPLYKDGNYLVLPFALLCTHLADAEIGDLVDIAAHTTNRRQIRYPLSLLPTHDIIETEVDSEPSIPYMTFERQDMSIADRSESVWIRTT